MCKHVKQKEQKRHHHMHLGFLFSFFFSFVLFGSQLVRKWVVTSTPVCVSCKEPSRPVRPILQVCDVLLGTGMSLHLDLQLPLLYIMTGKCILERITVTEKVAVGGEL